MVDAQKKGVTLIPDMGDWWGMIMAIIAEMGGWYWVRSWTGNEVEVGGGVGNKLKMGKGLGMRTELWMGTDKGMSWGWGGGWAWE